MNKIIQQPGLVATMGAESRKRAVEIFDEKKILEQTVQVYIDAGVVDV